MLTLLPKFLYRMHKRELSVPVNSTNMASNYTNPSLIFKEQQRTVAAASQPTEQDDQFATNYFLENPEARSHFEQTMRTLHSFRQDLEALRRDIEILRRYEDQKRSKSMPQAGSADQGGGNAQQGGLKRSFDQAELGQEHEDSKRSRRV